MNSMHTCPSWNLFADVGKGLWIIQALQDIVKCLSLNESHNIMPSLLSFLCSKAICAHLQTRSIRKIFPHAILLEPRQPSKAIAFKNLHQWFLILSSPRPPAVIFLKLWKQIYFLVNAFTFLILMFCNRHEVRTVAYKHRVSTMQIDKNRHNRTNNGEFGDRTTGLLTNTFLTLLFANPRVVVGWERVGTVFPHLFHVLL